MGVYVLTGDANRLAGINALNYNLGGYFGSLGPLFWFREAFVQHWRYNRDFFKEYKLEYHY